MLRFTATNVGSPEALTTVRSLKFSEDGNVVRFRIGERVYDKNAENNTRWVNINIKAFGNVALRAYQEDAAQDGHQHHRPL